MSENLTPEQIEAMLNGAAMNTPTSLTTGALSEEECDILGEVGNMCMGAAATTMYTILGRKVSITTPRVQVYPDVVSMLEEYNIPFIVVEVTYTEGVTGRNLLLLKTLDAAMITDIMMGGEGDVDPENIELTELHLSAISEIMNQMVAAGATSLSQLLSMPVNISPPHATLVDLAIDDVSMWAEDPENIIKISFQMEIEGLLNSELMQIMPYRFGKELVEKLLANQEMEANAAPIVAHTPAPAPAPSSPPPQAARAPMAPAPSQQQGNYAPHPAPQVNVQAVQYQTFDAPQQDLFSGSNVPENLDMIIDVPLQVTVELGKARRSIKEVLDFNVGSVIVLDKLAGELVEVVVNGKLIARGEVVVIDDNYGVRITEVVAPSRRL